MMTVKTAFIKNLGILSLLILANGCGDSYRPPQTEPRQMVELRSHELRLGEYTLDSAAANYFLKPGVSEQDFSFVKFDLIIEQNEEGSLTGKISYLKNTDKNADGSVADPRVFTQERVKIELSETSGQLIVNYIEEMTVADGRQRFVVTRWEGILDPASPGTKISGHLTRKFSVPTFANPFATAGEIYQMGQLTLLYKGGAAQTENLVSLDRGDSDGESVTSTTTAHPQERGQSQSSAPSGTSAPEATAGRNEQPAARAATPQVSTEDQIQRGIQSILSRIPQNITADQISNGAINEILDRFVEATRHLSDSQVTWAIRALIERSDSFSNLVGTALLTQCMLRFPERLFTALEREVFPEGSEEENEEPSHSSNEGVQVPQETPRAQGNNVMPAIRGEQILLHRYSSTPPAIGGISAAGALRYPTLQQLTPNPVDHVVKDNNGVLVAWLETTRRENREVQLLKAIRFQDGTTWETSELQKIQSINFSSLFGAYFVSTSEGDAYLWNGRPFRNGQAFVPVFTQTQLRLDGDPGNVLMETLSTNGRYLVRIYERFLLIIRFEPNGRQMGMSAGGGSPPQPFRSALISDDSRSAFLLGDSGVLTVNFDQVFATDSTTVEFQENQLSNEHIVAIALSAIENRAVALTADNKLKIFREGTLSQRLSLDMTGMNLIAIHPRHPNRIILAGTGGVYLLNLETRQYRPIQGLRQAKAILFLSDGSLLIGGKQGLFLIRGLERYQE